MGKKTKEHRAKVAKRNKRIGQDKYAMQNAFNRIMKQMAEAKNNEEVEDQLNIKVGGSEIPFSVVTEEELTETPEDTEN
jgi:uncharacterized protein